MGNDVLKELHREMSLDRVERLMDNTRDGVEYQRVSASLSRLHHVHGSLRQEPASVELG